MQQHERGANDESTREKRERIAVATTNGVSERTAAGEAWLTCVWLLISIDYFGGGAHLGRLVLFFFGGRLWVIVGLWSALESFDRLYTGSETKRKQRNKLISQYKQCIRGLQWSKKNKENVSELIIKQYNKLKITSKEQKLKTALLTRDLYMKSCTLFDGRYK